MALQRLGRDSKVGNSPTLYLSDKPSYLVQGWRTDADESIEIPHGLLQYLRPDTCLGAVLRDTGHGTFILTGVPVRDEADLAEMALPDHETAVEVSIGIQRRRDVAPGQ